MKPLHVRGWFTVRRTVWRLVVIFIFLCLLNGHYFFSNGIVAKTQTLSDNSQNNLTFSSQNNPTFSPKTNSLFFSESNYSFSSKNKAVFFSESGPSFLSTKSKSTSHTTGVILSTTTSCPNCTSTVLTAPKNDTETILFTYDCDSLTADWEYFEEMKFVYIDLCFDSLIPFLIMLICNVFIIVSLRRSAKTRPRNTTRRQLAKVQATKSYSDPSSVTGRSTVGPGQSGAPSSPSSIRTFSFTDRRQCLWSSSFPLQRGHNTSVSSHRSGDSLSHAEYDNPLFGDCTNSERHAEPEAGSSHSADETTNRDTSKATSTVQEMNSTVSQVNTMAQEMNSMTEGKNSAKPGITPTVPESNSMSQEVGRRRVSKTRGRLSNSILATSQGNTNTCSKYSFAQRKVTPPVSTHPIPGVHSMNNTTTETSSHSHLRETTSPQSSPNTSIKGSRDTTLSLGVTRILVLVTTVFFLTTLPSAIYFIADSYLREVGVGEESRTNRILNLVQAITNLLQFSNYGCNFLLYSSRSKRFRLEVKYMLGLVDSRFRRHFKSSVLSMGTTVRDNSTVTTVSRHKSSFPHTHTTTTSTQHDHHPPSTSLNGHVPFGSSQTQSEDDANSRNEHPPASEPEAEMRNVWENRHNSDKKLTNGVDFLSVTKLSSSEIDTESMEMSDVPLRHVLRRAKSSKTRSITSSDSSSHSGLAGHLETQLAGTIFTSKAVTPKFESEHVVDQYEENRPSNNRHEADILFDSLFEPATIEYNQKGSKKGVSLKTFAAKSFKCLTKRKRKLGSSRLLSSSVERLCPNCETWRHFAMAKLMNEDLIPVGEMVYEDRQRFCVRF